MFVATGLTANFSVSDLKAAVDAIDDGLDSLVNTHTGTDSVETALNKLLPQPVKADATVEQKGTILAYVAMKRYGVI
jgi:hypothetical protein